MRATEQEMIQAVREHALRNYEKGWDTVVECMSDEDIAKEVGTCRTTQGAIRKIGVGVRIYDAYRKEIQSTAW